MVFHLLLTDPPWDFLNILLIDSVCVCVFPYGSAAQVVQTQFVSQLTDSHGIWKILFVSKHQNDSLLQLVLLDLHTESCD